MANSVSAKKAIRKIAQRTEVNAFVIDIKDESGRVFSETIPEFSDLPRAFDEWKSEDYPLSQEVQEVLAAEAQVEFLDVLVLFELL